VIKKIKIKEILGIHQAIEQLRAREDLGKALVYALVKTKAKIQPVIDGIAAMRTVPEGLRRFEEARIALARRMASRDSSGVPIIRNNSFVIENLPDFESQLAALKKEYKADLDKLDSVAKEIQAHLEEMEEIDVHTITLDHMPENLSFDVAEKLAPMLEDIG
jgi:hypothetical protein